MLEVRGSARPIFAGPAVSPAGSGRCGCQKDPGTPTPSIGGWRGVLGNYEKVEWPTSLTHSSSSSQPDPAVGGPLLWTISLIFSATFDTQGKGKKMVHEASCPGVGRAGNTACWEGSSCARGFAAESLRKGFVSRLKMATKQHGKGEEWDPIRFVGNP